MSAPERAKVERDPVLAALDEAVAETGGRDALLLALRPVWRLGETEHQLCMDILEIHEAPKNRTFSLDVQHAAEMTSSEALHL